MAGAVCASALLLSCASCRDSVAVRDDDDASVEHHRDPSFYRPYGAFSTIDEWYDEPPLEIRAEFDMMTEAVPHVWEVSKSNFAWAENLLRGEKIVSYPFEDLSTLLGVGGMCAPVNYRVFLVRAVYLSPETGGFSAYFEDGILWVRHECLGNRPEEMKRSALVVALREAPREVYVSCTMDE